MLEALRRYWPILVGLATSIIVASQAIYSLGSARSDFEARDAHAEHSRMDLREDIDRHIARDGHEATAIRLERIEVQQSGISRDVGRVSEQLESLSKDVREAMRRDR